MFTPAQRKRHEQWLKELTVIPTAAGKEDRVIKWVKQWVDERNDLRLKTDRAGNLLVTSKQSRRGVSKATRPIFITAHLDHPAFVVTSVRGNTIELEFRGGVNDPYFEGAVIEIFDSNDHAHRAGIQSLNAAAKPFKTVKAKLTRAASTIRIGDIARWVFVNHDKLPFVTNGLFSTHACDDLAAVAAAVAMLDVLRARKDCDHVGVLLTRAEEIGFVGAIAACKHKSVSKNARLLCLENSRSFLESPIGGGPIVRVGDKMSVFGPTLTNRISAIMTQHQAMHPDFRFQRKLMPGGTCEATTFSTYGFESTCLCLPLGNYHNMQDIDGVATGKRRAKVGPEQISLDDYHGLIEMLVVCATQMDSASVPSLMDRMEELYARHKRVL